MISANHKTTYSIQDQAADYNTIIILTNFFVSTLCVSHTRITKQNSLIKNKEKIVYNSSQANSVLDFV